MTDSYDLDFFASFLRRLSRLELRLDRRHHHFETSSDGHFEKRVVELLLSSSFADGKKKEVSKVFQL